MTRFSRIAAPICFVVGLLLVSFPATALVPGAYTGPVAPTNAQVGQIWNDTSGSVLLPVERIYDGAQWVAQGTLNTTTHGFTIPSSSLAAALPSTTAGQLVTTTGTAGLTSAITPGLNVTNAIEGTLNTSGGLVGYNLIGTSGATIPLLNGENTASNYWDWTGGSVGSVNLYTTPPADYIGLSNAGSAFYTCPVTGCVSGAHQASSAYIKTTSQYDATIGEYSFLLDNYFNTGYSPAWQASHAYALGAEVDWNSNIYKVTTAGTSASSGGPSGTGASIADGSVVWAYQTLDITSAKVGFGVSTLTGPSAPSGVWGAAFDTVIGAGDNYGFRANVEFDTSNNGTACAPGVRNCYNAYFSGNVANKLTSIIGIAATGAPNPAAYYGIFLNGSNIASAAEIYDSGNAPIGLSLSGTYPTTGLLTPNMSFGTALTPGGAGTSGERIQVYGAPGAPAATDYAIGVNYNYLWFGSPSGFQWYCNGLTSACATLSNAGQMTAAGYSETLTTPASSSAACTAGQFTDDANYHYVCVGTNTWKRAALSAF